MSGSLRGILFLKQGGYNVSRLTIAMFKRKIFSLTIDASFFFFFFSIFFFVKRRRKQDCRIQATKRSNRYQNLVLKYQMINLIESSGDNDIWVKNDVIFCLSSTSDETLRHGDVDFNRIPAGRRCRRTEIKIGCDQKVVVDMSISSSILWQIWKLSQVYERSIHHYLKQLIVF